MGSDLYVSVTTGSFPLFRAGSCALERGIVVDAFEGDTHRVTAADWPRSLLAPCPWDEEAYWVRALPGAEFCTIVRDGRSCRTATSPTKNARPTCGRSRLWSSRF